MDPIGAGKAILKAARIAESLRQRLPTPKKALDAAWDEIIADTALEASAAIKRLSERLGEDAMEQIAATIETREGQGFCRLLFDAAVHAATKERTQLLCAALAGVFKPDLELELKARVARAVMQVEPSDILELRAAHRWLHSPPPKSPHPQPHVELPLSNRAA